MITVKLVVLQQLQTRASEPPKAFPRYNNYQVTYKVTLIEKDPLPSRYYPQSMVKKKMFSTEILTASVCIWYQPCYQNSGRSLQEGRFIQLSLASYWRRQGGRKTDEWEGGGAVWL